MGGTFGGIGFPGGGGDEEVLAFDEVTGPVEGSFTTRMRIEQSHLADVTLFQTQSTVIADNTLRSLADTEGAAATIRGNTILGGGIGLSGTSGSLIWKNTIIGSPTDGISLQGTTDRSSTTFQRCWTTSCWGTPLDHDGLTTGSSSLDICAPTNALCGPVSNTNVCHNTVRHNGRDGLHIESPSTTVARNLAPVQHRPWHLRHGLCLGTVAATAPQATAIRCICTGVLCH